MSDSIIIAIISGGFGFLSPLMVYVGKGVYDRRYLMPISEGRSSAVAGVWRGMMIQSSMVGSLDVNLEVKGKEISGVVKIIFELKGKERLLVLSLKGGFLYDHFIKLDYRNSNDGTIQFGTLILELPPDPSAMVGRFVGFGSITRKIVSGEVSLAKVFF